MDFNVLKKLNYGLFLAGSVLDGKRHGCVVNSFCQITSSSPQKFSLSMNNYGMTHAAVQKSGLVCITALAVDCPEEIVNTFGYKSGRVKDKFADFEAFTDAAGMPYLKQGMLARISLKVIETIDCGSHTLFILESTDGEVLGDGDGLTVHALENRGKVVPSTATVYRTMDENYGYVCTICGYIYQGEPLPADYRCPICKAPTSKFKKR